MYFSDEIFLIKEINIKNEFNQYDVKKIESSVWSNIGSVSASEVSDVGQNGHKAQARCTVHTEDYGGQKLVRIPEGIPTLTAGVYEVYRTYLSADTIELYLTETEGV